MLIHPRPGVEVELEGRAERIVQILARVHDELEASHRTRERGMREAGGEVLALRARKPDRRHDLHVEVARRGIEVAERGRAEQPRADETVAQPVAEARDELSEVGLDVRAEHPAILARRRTARA